MHVYIYYTIRSYVLRIWRNIGICENRDFRNLNICILFVLRIRVSQICTAAEPKLMEEIKCFESINMQPLTFAAASDGRWVIFKLY